MKIKNMKVGTLFQLLIMGAVYIRCRGGFRPALGGDVMPCDERKGAIYQLTKGE